MSDAINTNDGLVVSGKPKPPGLEELNSEVRSELMLFLGGNDIKFFIAKKTAGSARKEFNAGRSKGASRESCPVS